MNMQPSIVQTARRAIWFAGIWLSLLVLHLAVPDRLFGQSPKLGGGGFGPLGGFELAPEEVTAPPMAVQATWSISNDGKTGLLQIRGTPRESFYVYSVTQAAGGPKRTQLELVEVAGIKASGPPVPDVPAESHEYPVWPGLVVEEHPRPVTWTMPLTIESSVDPKTIEVKVLAAGQVCEKNGACIPFKETVVAEFVGNYTTIDADTRYRNKRSHSGWTIRLEPSTLQPGKTGALIFEVAPDAGYHVYAHRDTEDENTTLFVVDQRADLAFGPPETLNPVLSKELAPGLPIVQYHDGPVQWRIPVQIPVGAAAGPRSIGGLVAYQTCTETSCDPPSALRFSITLEIGDGGAEEVTFASVQDAKAKDVIEHSDRGSWSKELAALGPVERQAPERNNVAGTPPASTPEPVPSRWYILALSLLGGLLLNAMPCSLPVIGLKATSIISQAGKDHKRAFVLNLWYVLGILLFFWTLTALVLTLGLFIGEWNTYDAYNITMAVLVFVLALSMIGVWEVPIPGFATSSSASKLQKEEGWFGSLAKGYFTTILALSCAGPGIGVAAGYALDQPSWVVILIFTMMGLGMGLPFIVIGADPRTLKWLPKPGMWMEHFKQLMGFLMFGGSAFLFWSVSDKYRVPTLAMMMAAWLGVWIIGRVPPYAPAAKRTMAWVVGIACAAAISWLSFAWYVPWPTMGTYHIPWVIVAFLLAISLLGMWELPIPGVAPTGPEHLLHPDQTLEGDVYRGVVGTLLAAACTAWGLGVAASQDPARPAWSVVLAVVALGLCLALPLFVLQRQPMIAKHLKNWGVDLLTYKNLLGFAVLSGVVWMFGSVDKNYRTATLAAMLAAWFGVWFASRVPGYAPAPKRLTWWASGIACAALIGWASFLVFVPKPTTIPWEPFSSERLAELRRTGKTVMIDFTADWCLNCKLNSAIAIDRPAVARLIAEQQVVPMLADWTDGSEEIREKLEELRNPSIPFLVIYPGGQPDAPIKLPDILSEGQVLEALKRAGPSRNMNLAGGLSAVR